MAFVAVLDACVLYPASLRDVLLRLAAAEFYDLRWSDLILDEVERNLVSKAGVAPAGARGIRLAMDAAFDGAKAPTEAIHDVEPAMRTHRKDRHVLAAAVVSEAQVVVTSNLRDFPDVATEPYAIEAQHPDEFLAMLFALNGGLVADIVEQQAAALRNPPLSVDDVLAHLSLHVPVFVADVRRVLDAR